MQINIDKDDAQHMSVDRDSTRNDYGTEGMDIWIGGVKVHFEDEMDAVTLAQAILKRMGLQRE